MGCFHPDRRFKIGIAAYLLAVGWSWEHGLWGAWLYGPEGLRRANGLIRSERRLFGINRLRRPA